MEGRIPKTLDLRLPVLDTTLHLLNLYDAFSHGFVGPMWETTLARSMLSPLMGLPRPDWVSPLIIIRPRRTYVPQNLPKCRFMDVLSIFGTFGQACATRPLFGTKMQVYGRTVDFWNVWGRRVPLAPFLERISISPIRPSNSTWTRG